MRVAVSAMDCSSRGVSETHIAYQWVRQIAKHAEVDLITGQDSQCEIEGVCVHRVNAGRGEHLFSRSFLAAVKPDYFFFDYRAGRKYAQLVERADVFHHVVPQAPRYPSSLGRKSRRFVLGPVGGGLRVPVPFREQIERSEPLFAKLRQLDGMRFRFDPWLRRTYDAADVLLLTAPFMLEIVPDRYHSKADFLLETAIDESEYAEESSFRPEKEKTEILYVGRLTPYKGLEFLIRALACLPATTLRGTETHVAGSGDASYEARCRRLVEDLGLDEYVRFHGRLSRDEVRQRYRRADIFCFPTLAETTGNVILEAMAMGLPVVSANYGGPAAVLDKTSGFLVDLESVKGYVEGIAERLELLCGDPELRQSVGAKARARVLDEFSWSAKGERIKSIYEGVVAATKDRAGS